MRYDLQSRASSVGMKFLPLHLLVATPSKPSNVEDGLVELAGEHGEVVALMANTCLLRKMGLSGAMASGTGHFQPYGQRKTRLKGQFPRLERRLPFVEMG